MKPLAVAVLVLLPSLARAAPADDLLERGLRSYAVGRYDEAIDAFQRGYELEPRPDFLYALGQAQRMKGDCAAAVQSYRAYLRTSPPERAAAPARQNLARCEAELAAHPPPSPSTLPATPGATATPTANGSATGGASLAHAEAPRRWQRDPAAAALAAAGLAALGAGGALWGIGEAGARDLAAATRYDQFESAGDPDAFARERLAGIVTVAVGGALCTAAVARWIWVARHR